MSLGDLLSTLYHKFMSDNNGKPSFVEKYIGYISLLIMYSVWCLLVFIYKKCCVKCCKSNNKFQDVQMDESKQHLLGNDNNNNNNPNDNIDVNEQILNETAKQINIKDMYLKSAYNIFSDISDTMNSFIFIYYFKFYTNYS
eukprot:432438_1